ncbi:MAG: hypothetical protein J0J14_09635 [Hyphomicrobium sp.]|nr:hypothetical protein [Hyphomicrobium sp.]
MSKISSVAKPRKWGRGTQILLAGIAYVVTSQVLFDGWLKPIAIMDFWRDRVPPEYWSGPLAIGLIVGALVALILARTTLALVGPAVFIIVSMFTTVALTAMAVEKKRDEMTAQFKPDRLKKESFWRTIREAPADFQFFLHAAAMKQCVPYAWSYRRMDFYPLNAQTARNVIPPAWLIECGVAPPGRR